MADHVENSITDAGLIHFYKCLLLDGRIKEGGTAHQRLEYLKKRKLNKKYKRFMKDMKNGNGVI
tara:strand:- start:199 stop:390 length:192 start_codon:yes stop_codon:yes gene_type:complete